MFAAVDKLAAELRAQTFHGEPLRVEVDKRDLGGGTEKLGMDQKRRADPRRDRAARLGKRERGGGAPRPRRRRKRNFSRPAILSRGRAEILQSIQDGLLYRAPRNCATRIRCDIDTKEEFYAFFTPKNAEKPEIHGGFARSHWCGSPECEEKIKEDLKVTIRCIPFEAESESGACIYCGRTEFKARVFCEVVLKSALRHFCEFGEEGVRASRHVPEFANLLAVAVEYDNGRIAPDVKFALQFVEFCFFRASDCGFDCAENQSPRARDFAGVFLELGCGEYFLVQLHAPPTPVRAGEIEHDQFVPGFGLLDGFFVIVVQPSSAALRRDGAPGGKRHSNDSDFGDKCFHKGKVR